MAQPFGRETRKWMAILKMLCPQCRQAKVFSGLFRMNRECPRCGLKFEKEPGYFLGAMYISYGMATALMMAGILLLRFLTSLSFHWVFGIMVGVLWLATPWIFRYSRVIFMYTERTFFRDGD